jgi:hypothetical protein
MTKTNKLIYYIAKAWFLLGLIVILPVLLVLLLCRTDREELIYVN